MTSVVLGAGKRFLSLQLLIENVSKGRSSTCYFCGQVCSQSKTQKSKDAYLDTYQKDLEKQAYWIVRFQRSGMGRALFGTKPLIKKNKALK